MFIDSSQPLEMDTVLAGSWTDENRQEDVNPDIGSPAVSNPAICTLKEN